MDTILTVFAYYMAVVVALLIIVRGTKHFDTVLGLGLAPVWLPIWMLYHLVLRLRNLHG